MAQTLSTLSTISYIAAAVFLFTAVILFIALSIPRVYSDYTGRTARKRIMKLRAANEKSGDKSYTPSKENKERGKITEKVVKPKKNEKMPDTGILNSNKAKRYDAEATGRLIDDSTVDLNPPAVKDSGRKPNIKLKKIDDIMLVHTDEVIS